MLPDKSEGSVKNGIWFVHEDGSNLIHVWGSTMSGKEKVFLNNQIVSEGRTVKMKSGHIFQDENGANYEVKIETVNLAKGSLMCSLVKNDELIKTFKSTIVRGKGLNMKTLVAIILASTIFAVLASIFDFSNLEFGLFSVLIVVIVFLTRAPIEFVIEE